MKQLVYRYPDVGLLDSIHCGKYPDGAVFKYLSGPVDAISDRTVLAGALGLKGFLVMLAKLSSGRRHFYGVFLAGRLVHRAWISLGFCRYYKIPGDAVVVGPIGTSEEVRGKGIALYALMEAMKELVRKNHRIIYIDTSEDNVAAQRVFQKAGFGPPVSAYERRQEQAC